ncbi:K1210 protein, partial [Upupa epops]|nr:K1210 protein [Upupa epops]
KEIPGVKSPTDAASGSGGSTLGAEESCALLPEDACFPDVDHHYKAATFLLRPEPSPVNLEKHQSEEACCSNESAAELKSRQENASTKASALPKLQQIGGEPVVFPEVLAANLFSNGLETEDTDMLADVALKSSVNSMDPNIKHQEKGDPLFNVKVEGCMSAIENHPNHAASDPPPSISQAAVAASESSDTKTVAVLKPENSSITRNDKVCEIVESQSSEGNAETKPDTVVSVPEAGCMLPPSKLEVAFKAETDSVSKRNQGSHQANASHSSEKLSIACLASSSLAGLKSNISSDDDSREHQISSTASHRKTVEDCRSSDENVRSPLKTASAKPVRFTIAPAWQRSLSGGSNSKGDSYNRNSPTSPIRPELFEGLAKEHSRFDTVIQESARTSSDVFDRDCKDSGLHLSSSMEWADQEGQNTDSPFGVRLRRTSSLLKYQNESRAESSRPFSSVVPTASSASVKESQNSLGIEKLPLGLPVSTKSFVKKPDLLDDKNPPKTRADEVAKKQNDHKPPAWVSMAKLKQKGFQDHPLAKEYKTDDKALTKADQEEVEYQRMLCGCKVGPIAQEASVIPALEKEARHSSNLPVTPCSPAEPPWLSLAKKKAKAWSEMPQIVQ